MEKHSRGFTLIELLVVIAVIALMATVVLAALGSAHAKARDSQRQSDLREVQSAIEGYFSDNGSYPNTGGNFWGNCSGFGSHPTSGATGYIPNLAPKYIPVLPLDPIPSNNACYTYKSDGKNYMFLIFQTVEGKTPPSLVRPTISTENDYAVYSPGGAGY